MLSTDSSRRLGIWRILSILPLAGLYAPVFADLARAWWNDQYAGHGLFVPAFSALLAWRERDRVRSAAGSADPAGILVLLVALALLAAGRWSGSLLVQSVSVVVAVAGALLATCGRGCLRIVAFPVTFLVFMAPPPSAVVDFVTLHLQLFAARVAGGVLDVLEVPFYQSGLVIVLPAMTLQVAEVCNGLRFLMALLVLTMAFAYVTQRSPHRMAVLVASAIPIAILANAVRVATIALAVQYVGPHAASGAIHHAIGKGVWALTLVPLAGIGFWLGRRGRSGGTA